jgi:hypothetical protein
MFWGKYWPVMKTRYKWVVGSVCGFPKFVTFLNYNPGSEFENFQKKIGLSKK